LILLKYDAYLYCITHVTTTASEPVNITGSDVL